MGNGLSQCLLCGEVLGFLGSSSVFCKDCRKVSPALASPFSSPEWVRTAALWLCSPVSRTGRAHMYVVLASALWQEGPEDGWCGF